MRSRSSCAYEIAYKYRPYLNLPMETVTFPNQQAALPFIQRHRGTEVSLIVRTNRPLQDGGVKLVTGKLKKDLHTEILRDDPRAFRCQWTLEQSGDFFVSFTSSEREIYTSRIPFPVDVLVDATPTVTLTQPKQNVEMPANGTLEVQGLADDDLGLKALTLRLELVEAGKGVPSSRSPIGRKCFATSTATRRAPFTSTTSTTSSWTNCAPPTTCLRSSRPARS